MLVVLSATFILVDLFVAIMQVTISVEIMQLQVSAPFIHVKVSAANMWVTIFIEIMDIEVPVTIMQVVFSTVHYAHDCVSIVIMQVTGCSYICDNFKQQLYIPFYN